jgi:hypothetical protein
MEKRVGGTADAAVEFDAAAWQEGAVVSRWCARDLKPRAQPSIRLVVVAALAQRIQDAYERLGHQLGWRFLYTPERTL